MIKVINTYANVVVAVEFNVKIVTYQTAGLPVLLYPNSTNMTKSMFLSIRCHYMGSL